MGLLGGGYAASSLGNPAWVVVGLVLGALVGNLFASSSDPDAARKRRNDGDDDDDDDDDEPPGARRFYRYEDAESDYFERSDYYDAAEDEDGF